MSINNKKIRVGITIGDPNGIGCEVVLKALDDPRMPEMFTPIIYGSQKIANFYRNTFEPCEGSEPLHHIESASDARHGVSNIIDVVGDDVTFEPGKPSEKGGEIALACLERAVADLREGLIDVIVTGPIDKHAIQSPTFSFPGHTEYLQASLTDPEDGCGATMVMATSTGLRVALLTAHMPLSKVAASVTKDSVLEKIEALNKLLRRDFRVLNPRIAVLSLNPHCGENGLLGTEEETAIKPAILEGRDKDILVFGPYASDGFFGAEQYTHFDGVLAMYHDQGLTPFKVLAMENGVNYTAGLPYVRTSPDHGTAYDIAGKGVASAISMREAIFMAIDIYRNRMVYDEAHANPLRKLYHNKGKDADLPAETEEQQ